MNLRNIAILGVVILGLFGLYSFMGPGTAGMAGKSAAEAPQEITYSQLLQRIEAGEIATLVMKAE